MLTGRIRVYRDVVVILLLLFILLKKKDLRRLFVGCVSRVRMNRGTGVRIRKRRQTRKRIGETSAVSSKVPRRWQIGRSNMTFLCKFELQYGTTTITSRNHYWSLCRPNSELSVLFKEFAGVSGVRRPIQWPWITANDVLPHADSSDEQSTKWTFNSGQSQLVITQWNNYFIASQLSKSYQDSCSN